MEATLLRPAFLGIPILPCVASSKTSVAHFKGSSVLATAFRALSKPVRQFIRHKTRLYVGMLFQESHSRSGPELTQLQPASHQLTYVKRPCIIEQNGTSHPLVL